MKRECLPLLSMLSCVEYVIRFDGPETVRRGHFVVAAGKLSPPDPTLNMCAMVPLCPFIVQALNV